MMNTRMALWPTALALVALLAGFAMAADPVDKAEAPAEPEPTEEAPPLPEAQIKAGEKAFVEVAKVLQSPRCMNCHPSGDRPLQTDDNLPHAMNVSRLSVEAGLECATCHREENSEAMGVDGGPPGAPHWGLPPKDTPMVFEGLTPRQLCEQLKDPAQNGGKNLAGLMGHVIGDPLVLWGWNPGGNRTKPPMSHEAFVGHFKVWVESRGACPPE